MKVNKKRLAFLCMFLVFLGGIFLFSFSAVDNTITAEDQQYIHKFLQDVPPLPAQASYSDQLAFISAVQHAVLTAAPENTGLPLDQPRELKQLYEAQKGLCFDRSRAIEKILRYSGFETRHIFLLSTKRAGSAWQALLTPNGDSHAVTEVRTLEGWLVIDSNDIWLSLDKNNHPVSMDEIQLAVGQPAAIAWKQKPPIKLYQQPFTFVYGLYSRHGRFYPPYNFVPDVQYTEFSENLFARP